MKKPVLLFLALFMCMTSASAASVSSNVTSVKTASSYSAPSGYEPKGYIGNIISQIFDAAGRIQNQYVSAFQSIQGNYENNIPRWDELKFVQGTITDTGTNIGIGVSTPGEKLVVSGRISISGNPNTDDDVGNRGYNDARYIEIGSSGDQIQDGTIDSSEIQNGTITGTDIANNSITASDLGTNSVGNDELIDSPTFDSITLTSNTIKIRHFTNTFLGINSGGSNSLSLGINSALGNSAPYQTSIGTYSGNDNAGWYQTAIGVFAGNDNARSHQTAIGYRAGLGNTGYYQTAVGSTAGEQNTGSYNTSLGYRAGYNNSGNSVIGVGNNAAKDNSGSYVLALGFGAGEGNTRSNQFIVERSTSANGLLIQGDFSTGNVGIGTSTPSQRLDVNGKIRMRTQTTSGDSNDIVATKGYVDAIQTSIPICNSTDKSLGWDGSSWTCNTISGGSGSDGNSDDLVFGTHKIDDCAAAGGTVYNTGIVKICRFSGNSCPTSWNRYQQWGSTTRRTCSPAYGSSCSTGSHGWANQSVETCAHQTCSDTDKGCRTTTCFAITTQIGCY